MELPQGELDLVMAEAAEVRTDAVNRDRNHGKWCTAGYFLELMCTLKTEPALMRASLPARLG
jgi:hypothetical protein